MLTRLNQRGQRGQRSHLPYGDRNRRRRSRPRVANLWGWAQGYIQNLGWALAPVWLTADLVPGGLPGGVTVGCCCKDGEACTAWGKHLVSGLGVAHDADEVEEVWPTTHAQVLAGHVGIAVMTGSESRLLVLDVGSGSAITRARFKMATTC